MQICCDEVDALNEAFNSNFELNFWTNQFLFDVKLISHFADLIELQKIFAWLNVVLDVGKNADDYWYSDWVQQLVETVENVWADLHALAGFDSLVKGLDVACVLLEF